MFYVLSKLFGIVTTSPVSYCVFFLLVALWTNKRSIKAGCIVVSCVLLFLCSNQFVYDAAIKKWSASYINAWDSSKVYKYGIVLGGFANYDSGLNRLEFNESADRWIDGVLLYKSGHIQKLIIASDGSITSVNNAGNPKRMMEYLTTLGVAPDDILFETEALNTRENATLTLPLLGDNTDACLLITSAAHMKRSVSCFKQVGIVSDAYITDIEIAPARNWRNWIPNFGLFSLWQSLIHEWIGSVVYAIMGY